MADDAYRLASFVDGLDEVRDLRVAPELIRRPTARDYDPVKLQRIHLVCRNVRSSLEEILAGDRLRARSRGDHLRPLLPKTHNRHPVLEVLEPLGNEHHDLLTPELHVWDPFFYPLDVSFQLSGLLFRGSVHGL